MQKELDKLKKYNSSETVIAININRSIECSKLKEIRSELQLNVKEIWLYGSISADQTMWFLYGDLLSERRFYKIAYPGSDKENSPTLSW